MSLLLVAGDDANSEAEEDELVKWNSNFAASVFLLLFFPMFLFFWAAAVAVAAGSEDDNSEGNLDVSPMLPRPVCPTPPPPLAQLLLLLPSAAALISLLFLLSFSFLSSAKSYASAAVAGLQFSNRCRKCK